MLKHEIFQKTLQNVEVLLLKISEGKQNMVNSTFKLVQMVRTAKCGKLEVLTCSDEVKNEMCLFPHVS